MTEVLEIVTGLNIFPIKSCHAATVDGSPVGSLEVSATGFAAHDVRDREFVLFEADSSGDGSHLFLSQRGWGENGRLDRSHAGDNALATVHTDISERFVTVTSAIGELELLSRHVEEGERRRVRVHSSFLEGVLDQGPEAAKYFSELVGRSVRLGRSSRVQQRMIGSTYQRETAANTVAAADAHPFLLVSEASLAQSHIQNDLPLGTVSIDQYRGNIVVAGDVAGAYDEDYWREIKISDVGFYVVKACARCPMPNVDQESGERTVPGMKVLRGRDGYLEAGGKRDTFFGQNLNHRYRPGQHVAVGDRLTVIERAAARNFVTAA